MLYSAEKVSVVMIRGTTPETHRKILNGHGMNQGEVFTWLALQG